MAARRQYQVLKSVVRASILAVLTGSILVTEATAQTPLPDTAAARRTMEQRFGRSLSQMEIMERLRQSGMTRTQLRIRLQQAGYDPNLADRYFDAMERGGEPPRGPATDTFMEALNRIGVSSHVRPDSLAADSLYLLEDDFYRPPDPDTLGPREMEVFGLRTFRRMGSQFRPVQYGPVDAGYRLGPGDEIILVLTGDVEDAYSLDVTREGLIFIPNIGRISVNGLTLAQLEDMLYSQLSRVYSGISRSPNATTRFSVTLGQLRVNQITVTGDVLRPGSYAVSSVGGLFNALYQAGGPTVGGSFRRVEVWRGGRLFHVADLYDFLTRGDGSSDVRLEHNDRIFVPPAGPQARVEGAVRRPAVYEVKPGEGVRNLIAFAGGLRSDALVRRVQIDRILPPNEQQPGRYRTLVDVDLMELGTEEGRVPIAGGDVVTVSSVSSEVRRNRVWVDGEVRHPGLFEWSPAATLWTVLTRADGPTEQAYTARAHVYRLNEADGTRLLIPVSLERDGAGRPLHDLPLADNDSIVVLNRAQLRTEEFVTIHGWVKKPDTYTLARGMTLRDLILAAEGFAHGANVVQAEVSRLTDPLRRTDTTAYVIRVDLAEAGSDNGPRRDELNRDDVLPRWLPEASELQLQHGDRVFIRRAPGYEPSREVHVTGEVMAPGGYVLASREERVVDVIERAGGLTRQAFAGGIRVVRGGHTVAADVRRALQRPSDPNNITLQSGDSVHIPAYDPMVVVTGAVTFEARVLYVPGKNLNYYINQAGGYADNADKKRLTVTYANGERSAREDRWVGSSSPRVEPGSEIFVPERPADTLGTNWDAIITRTAGLLSALATALIAYNSLK